LGWDFDFGGSYLSARGVGGVVIDEAAARAHGGFHTFELGLGKGSEEVKS
jgi:hypothetical protein